MKRCGHLFEQVTSFQNMLTAFRLARRGCGNTPAVCQFFFRLEPELLRLQEELQQQTYQPGAYRYFTIHDPKERLIAVAPFRDRVVHHAIVGVLTPLYERLFIYDSYATRPAKGTHQAVLRAQHFLRRRPWYLKIDIAQYFHSIRHDTLLNLLQRTIKDTALLKLLERIIRNPPEPGQGLPIGNLTSQFLANVYLDPFDHTVKDEWGLKGYLRYMDDMVFFSHDKQTLLALRQRIIEELSETLALRLKERATTLNRSSHGLSFLGMRIFPRLIRVRPENRRRSLKKLRQTFEAWEQGKIDEEEMQHRLVSLVGHLKYFCPQMPLAFHQG